MTLHSQGEFDQDPGRPTVSACLGQRVTQDIGFAVLTRMPGHVLMTSQLSAPQLSAQKEGWQVCVVGRWGPGCGSGQVPSGSPSVLPGGECRARPPELSVRLPGDGRGFGS